jgi:hypothetical protein
MRSVERKLYESRNCRCGGSRIVLSACAGHARFAARNRTRKQKSQACQGSRNGRAIRRSVVAHGRTALWRLLRPGGRIVGDDHGRGEREKQYGIGMVCDRITEMVLRDERSAMPIGSYNAKYGVTLSLPSIIRRDGVVRLLEPEMPAAEQQALDRSAEAIREAVHAADIIPR